MVTMSSSHGLLRRCAWRAATFLVILIGLAAPVSAAEPFCKIDPLPPGTNGCLPTPLECATGMYNGFWDGGAPGQSADCVGGGNHVIQYAGGGNGCGAVINNDHMDFGSWYDPNVCSPVAAPQGYGVPGSGFLPAERSAGGVVASIAPEAAAAGIAMLNRGGNAIDAAVATVFAVGVARPDECGIGGGGLLVYRSAAGEIAALDFRETAPAALTSDMLFGSGINQLGYGHAVVGVPGTVAGMAAALGRFGRLTLADVIAPAEALARGGIEVSTGMATAYFYTLSPVSAEVGLNLFEASAAIYLDATRRKFPPSPSSPKLVQSDYAASLRLIMQEDPDAFYRGPIAQKIVADMEQSQTSAYPGDKGVMTLDDLANYRVRWRHPVGGTYHGIRMKLRR